MDQSRFLGFASPMSVPERTAPVPAVGAFMACPLVGQQTAACVLSWQQLHQAAFEQARAQHQRQWLLARFQAPCWN